MPNSESLRAIRRDLRRAGISSRVSTKDSTVLLLPGLGGEAVAALRLLYPSLQDIRVQTSINPKPPKK
jgi:hypothetical protein